MSLRLSQVATGNLAKDMLKTEDAFIVDNETEIFVWVGKGATADERKAALSHGQDYVTKQVTNLNPNPNPNLEAARGEELRRF